MRGATVHPKNFCCWKLISIHAPHAGRDSYAAMRDEPEPNFNPRAPCGARPPGTWRRILPEQFQSTRPMRGATTARPYRAASRQRFQSTRPVWGATGLVRYDAFVLAQFQSTRPVWGATSRCSHTCVVKRISIHAPRMGRDQPAHAAHTP